MAEPETVRAEPDGPAHTAPPTADAQPAARAQHAADAQQTAQAQRPAAPHAEQFASQERILGLVWGYMSSDIVDVAVRLGIPEQLADGAHTAGDVAAAAGTDPVATLRFLRAFAVLGLAEETQDGRFALTPAGRRLRPDVPDSLHAFVRQGSGVFRRAWARLEHSVRTGEPGFDEEFGTDFFHHLAGQPELAETFASSMREATRTLSTALAEVYDFSAHGRVVDVGGADGTLLTTVLGAHPGVHGVVFDSPAGGRDAPATVRKAGLAGRCRVETGDFFDAVPPGGDLYVLKSILHDWSDERSARILRSCRAAVPEHGRLLVVEVLLPERATPDAHPLAFLSDLYVLVNMGGRERSARDLDALLTATGFRTTRVASPPALAPFSLVEAVPVPDA
ncbi:methyltransferase [Streptomyces cacaoi]|uniref:Methyltransferase n=1 Tax=Streptomyces cacaoi TaxID=1898 RepID=A0A4Y3R3C6_STRCI|nr:methyltransferase [Streptomyces cacaoi]NNG89054.1 methyltransferase [Streptomyces cacaoi]GEB52014.1 methyltransferase [Streptomyces cacaoi]